MTEHQIKFWHVVRNCLYTIHGMDSRSARETVATFIEMTKASEAAYQFGPFAVSCALTNTDLDVRDYFITLLEIYENAGL